MAEKTPRPAETLRFIYTPKPGEQAIMGTEPIVVDMVRAPKRFRAEEASGKDAAQIADTMLRVVPGERFDRSNIQVERIRTDGFVEMLHFWDHKTERAYQKKVKAGIITPHTEDARRKAKKDAVPSAEADWDARKLDAAPTWGKWRGRWRAWNPVLSEHHVLGGAVALARKDAGWVFGLGYDTRDIRHELAPGRTVAEYQHDISKILRRLQDTVLDPADIVHGIGKSIVAIIEEHQRGLDGIALAAFQARFPKLREAISTVIAVETVTSPDRRRAQATLLSYEAAEEEALHRRLGIKHEKPEDKKGKKASAQPEAPAANATDDAQVAPESTQEAVPAESTPAATPTENPATTLRKNLVKRAADAARKQTGVYVHRFFWAPSSVVATELDRRSERQDRIDIAYLDRIINDPDIEKRSPVEQRYRLDLAMALVGALTEQRTAAQKLGRRMSGESEELEQAIEARLEAFLPAEVVKIVKAGLERLKGQKSELPADYVEALKALKTSEINDSYGTYFMNVGDASEKFKDRTDIPEPTRELWRQAHQYDQTLTVVANHAYRALHPLRRSPQSASAQAQA
ncbi:MAG TPA: hypothetical protein VFQ63_03240 [Patescibacteria group bacterium]|nr:hypothetical protein [Patescibacteria group bacterium]